MESRGGSSLLNRAQECTRLEDPKRHHNKGTTEYNYPVEAKEKKILQGTKAASVTFKICS